jgi:Competence-damaged protein
MNSQASGDVPCLAEELLDLAKSNELGLITAESCTAGLLGQALADAPAQRNSSTARLSRIPKNRKRPVSAYPQSCSSAKGPSAAKSRSPWRRAHGSDLPPM